MINKIIDSLRQFNLFTRKKVVTNIGTLFFGSVVARILSALTIFIIARKLGPEEFGLYVASLSLAKLTSVFFSLGLDSWLLKNGRQSNVSQAATASLVLKISLGSIWLFLISIFIALWNSEAFPLSLFFLSALSWWFEELINSILSAFKSILLNNITIMLLIGTQGGLLLVTLVLAGLGEENILLYLFGRVFVTGVSCIIALYFLVRFIGRGTINIAYLKNVLRDTLPFGLSHGLAIIYERADITIVAYALGTTAAGIYAPAISLMTTLYMVPLAIYDVMLPYISNVYIERPSRLKRLTFQTVSVSALLGMGMGMIMAIFAYPLVWLVYGIEFNGSSSVLINLSPILILKSISFALAAVLAAVGWQSKRVVVQAVAAIVNVSLNLFLIGIYGLVSVAFIFLISESLLMLGYLFLTLHWQNQHAALFSEG